jgi:hypothetical protein
VNYLIIGGNRNLRGGKAASLGSGAIKTYGQEDKNKHIGIDFIRDLRKDLATKRSELELIFIGNADKMTLPAQNAFLKLLEEPPKNTGFCLGVKNREQLLPTIISRCAILKIKQEFSIKEDTETIGKAGSFLSAAGAGVGGLIEYKNRIKKDLKSGDADNYFAIWLGVLRDALLLRNGADSQIVFKSLKAEIEKSFKPFEANKLKSAAQKGSKLLNLLQSSNIGPDRAASVFLMQFCPPTHL